MRIPRLPSLSTPPRIFALFASLGPALWAQSVFDVADVSSGNFNAAGTWTLSSGSGTSPLASGEIAIVNTSALANASTEVAMNNSYTIAALTFGTANGATDVARTITFRGSGDVLRSLTITGDLSKYDSGTLTFRHRGQSTGEMAVAVGGDVNLHAGILNFGAPNSSTHGLNSLNVAGATTLSGGTMNLRVATDSALGALALSGGTLNLNAGAVVSGDRVISVRSLSGSGGSIGEASTGAGAVLTLAVTGAGAHAYSGVITNGSGTGTIAFKMAGSGVQTLSSANTYAGGTTVESGSLLVNNTTGSGVGTGAVVVKAGAIFGGDGIVALGDAHGVTVESGGVLAAGGGTHALRFDGSGTTGALLTMNTGSILALDLGGNAASPIDFWNYSGATDLALGGAVMNITGAQSDGVYTLLRFYSDNGASLTESGIVSGLVLGSGLEQFETAFLTYGPNAVTLTLAGMSIPEPGAAAALAGLFVMGAACGLRCRRP